MQNQKDHNQIHKIYIEKLCENKMSRNSFLQILKQLPQLKQFNNFKSQKLKHSQTKCNLGLLNLYQLINLFQFLDQNQSSQVPLDQVSVFTDSKLSQWDRIRLNIQEMVDAYNLQSKGCIESNSPYTIIHHRLISEAIITLKPQFFKVSTILFQDQNLTQTLRTLYDLSQKDYQKLLKLNRFDQKGLQKKVISIENSIQICQMQKVNQQTEKNGFESYFFEEDYKFFQIILEDRKKIRQKICQIPVGEFQGFYQNYKYAPLQFSRQSNQKKCKNSSEQQEDFLNKQRTRVYNQVMIDKQEGLKKRTRKNGRIGWTQKEDEQLKVEKQHKNIQKKEPKIKKIMKR